MKGSFDEEEGRRLCFIDCALPCVVTTYPMKLSKSIERLPAKERSNQHSRSPHLETVLSPLPRAWTTELVTFEYKESHNPSGWPGPTKEAGSQVTLGIERAVYSWSNHNSNSDDRWLFRKQGITTGQPNFTEHRDSYSLENDKGKKAASTVGEHWDC